MSEESHHVTATDQRGVKTLKSYIIGLLLSLILTLTSFTLVGYRLMSTVHLYLFLVLLALVQLFVQVICFLRLNASPAGRWNLMPFLFTILVVLVLVIGSLWIMINLNYNMMH